MHIPFQYFSDTCTRTLGRGHRGEQWLWKPPPSSILQPLSLGLTRLPAPMSDSGHEYSQGHMLVQQAVTQKPLAGAGVGGGASSLGARCG